MYPFARGRTGSEAWRVIRRAPTTPLNAQRRRAARESPSYGCALPASARPALLKPAPELSLELAQVGKPMIETTSTCPRRSVRIPAGPGAHHRAAARGWRSARRTGTGSPAVGVGGLVDDLRPSRLAGVVPHSLRGTLAPLLSVLGWPHRQSWSRRPHRRPLTGGPRVCGPRSGRPWSGVTWTAWRACSPSAGL